MPAKRYRAFISYSQKDEIVASRLHGWLESYRVPVGVVAEIDDKRRLGRFFRDEEEMPASPDLASTIRGAIDDTESLIVVCSPHAAQSKWVNAEILHFRQTGRGGKVFAVIAAGTPNSGDVATECFPPALRTISADGSMPIEPLALDLRKESKARVCARMAAGLLDISFDDLWRREQRRRRAFFARVSVGGVAIVAIIAVLALRMIGGQQEVRARDRTARLALVAETIDSNEREALATLRELLIADPEDPAINDVADTILSWAKTPDEIIAAAPSPVFIGGVNRISLRVGETIRQLGEGLLVRRMGFSGGRVLAVFRDRLVAVDERTGQVLDVVDDPGVGLQNHLWRGLAFEAADGTAVLAGAHYGISNSQYWHSLVALSPDGKLSVMGPLQHPALSDDFPISRFINDAFVSADCAKLGVFDGGDKDAVADGHVKFWIDMRDGLSYGESALSVAGAAMRLIPEADEDATLFRIVSDRAISEHGCRPPVFDTAMNSRLLGPGGMVWRTDLAFSPPTPAEWRAASPANDQREDHSRAAEWNRRALTTDATDFCASEGNEGGGGCLVVGSADPDERFYGEDQSALGWVRTAMPASGSLSGSLVEEFALNPLHTYHVQHNAGIESAWCRRLPTGDPACLTSTTGAEYVHEWALIDSRSGSGRFVFYSTGTAPFEVFDVQAMREATPRGNRIESLPGAAVFSDSIDDRLFVFAGSRLSVFEPDDSSGLYTDKSDALTWNRELAVGEGNAIIALAYHPASDLIAVAGNGLLVRFNWQSGAVVWSRRVSGIGTIQTVRRSPAGDHLAVLGEAGIRLLRTGDGLLTSGVLFPPYLFDPGFDLSRCRFMDSSNQQLTDVMTDLVLEEQGRLIVQCGSARFSWQPQAFRGDRLQRVDSLLGTGQ